MTCVVGVVHEGVPYLGADSLSSDWHRKWTRDDPKVFRVGGGDGEHRMAAGICGSWRLRDVLMWDVSLDPPRVNADIDRWVRKDFMAELRAKLKDCGALRIKDSVESLPGADFLLAAAGRLFYVGEDLHIGEEDGWGHAVGSGLDVARGVLWHTRNEKDPVKRLLAALEAAEALITTVRGPFRIYRFQNGELHEEAP